jgi:hypothetical protein
MREPLLELHLQAKVAHEADDPLGLLGVAERKRREIDGRAIATCAQDLRLYRLEPTWAPEALAEKAAPEVRPDPGRAKVVEAQPPNDLLGGPTAELGCSSIEEANPARNIPD